MFLNYIQISTLSMNSGLFYEKLACEFLIGKGLKLVSKNFSCRFGEIDLIMQDQKTLVFVEVRKRASQLYGGAAASVSHKKQQKIILTAQSYLQTLSTVPICRFDVIAIEGNQQQINWIKNAFSTQ